MKIKAPKLKCGTCQRIDRETYRGVSVAVCYFLQKKDNKPVAITVTDKKDACSFYCEA